MRFDAGTRTRLTARMTFDFDPADTTVEVKVDGTWYPAEWQGSATQSGGKWLREARTVGYFAGPEVASPGAAVVLAATPSRRHPTQTRVTSGTDIITADSDPIDIA